MYEEQIQTITAQVAEGLAEQSLPFAPDQRAALELLRASRYGAEAAVIGTVTNREGVVALTPIGGKRRVSVLYGEGLPRIC